LESWNIIHGFRKLLFKYYKLDIKQYADICKKRLDVREREDIKQLIRIKEIVKLNNDNNGSCWTVGENIKVISENNIFNNRINCVMERKSENYLEFLIKVKMEQYSRRN
jgi:hypothetical protein